MQNVLVVFGVITFCLGVAIQTIIPMSLATGVWWLFLSLVLGLVWRLKNTPYLLILSVMFLLFSLGVIRTEVYSWKFGQSPLVAQIDQEVTLKGVVVSEPERKEKTTQLFIETSTDKILVSTDRLTSVDYGDQVTVNGKLEVPDNFVTELGRTFNYVGYLKAKGVEYRISFAEVEVLNSGSGNFLLSFLLWLKTSFITAVNSVIPEPAVGLGNGLLLGVKAALGEEIENDFRQTGIIHIVVLSGHNVMLVVAFIMLFFSFFLSLRARLVAGAIAIVCFALTVGLSATVVRASIMAVLVLLAQFLGRNYDVMRALLLAGLLMVFINPYILMYDIGFQLSFMATLGLLLIVPHFENALMKGEKLLGLKDFLLATLATQIAVFPLLLYHIGEVSLIAVVVNVLVLPVVPVAMLLTFLTGIMAHLSFSIAMVIGWLATISLNYILAVAHWFASLPFASVKVPVFSSTMVLFSYLLMAIMYWYFNRKAKKKL